MALNLKKIEILYIDSCEIYWYIYLLNFHGKTISTTKQLWVRLTQQFFFSSSDVSA
jgi:hypothetical protein